MSTVATTFVLVPATLAKASEVNQNFKDLVDYINLNAIVKDASLAFTSVPSGPAGVNPSSADHLVRKGYVDSGLLSWTPGYVSVTLGTGATNIGRYWKNGREVHFFTHLVLGTGGSVTGTISLDWAGKLPAAHSDFAANNLAVAFAWADVAGVNRTSGVGIMADGNNNRVGRFAGGPAGSVIGWDANEPGVWAAGAQLNITGKYLTA